MSAHTLSLRPGRGVLQVVDARSSGRFYGTAPEPRAGMRGGHIPGSRSVPFDEVLLEGKSGLKSPEKIKEIFSGELAPQATEDCGLWALHRQSHDACGWCRCWD